MREGDQRAVSREYDLAGGAAPDRRRRGCAQHLRALQPALQPDSRISASAQPSAPGESGTAFSRSSPMFAHALGAARVCARLTGLSLETDYPEADLSLCGFLEDWRAVLGGGRAGAEAAQAPVTFPTQNFAKDPVDDPRSSFRLVISPSASSAADRSTAATSSGMPSSIAVTASQSAARARPAAHMARLRLPRIPAPSAGTNAASASRAPPCSSPRVAQTVTIGTSPKACALSAAVSCCARSPAEHDHLRRKAESAALSSPRSAGLHLSSTSARIARQFSARFLARSMPMRPIASLVFPKPGRIRQQDAHPADLHTAWSAYPASCREYPSQSRALRPAARSAGCSCPRSACRRAPRASLSSLDSAPPARRSGRRQLAAIALQAAVTPPRSMCSLPPSAG